MYFKKLCRFSSISLFATFGIIFIFLVCATDSCVLTSNVLILSTSSPKNSIRKGSSLENENTSTIPPLTENSPGSVTKSTRLNLYSKSTSLTKSIEILSPSPIFSVLRSNSLRVTTCSKSASG